MRLTGMIVAAGLGLFAAGGAQALPIDTAPMAGASDAVTLVRDGCGFGAHRGPYGGCRLDRGPRRDGRRFYAPPRARFCPPGTYRIPGTGVCRRGFMRNSY